MKIPSHLPPRIRFLTMKVSTEFYPPSAMFALILSDIVLSSIVADEVSTNKIPYPKFFEMTFLFMITILASLSAFIPAFLLYPINVLDSILVKFLAPVQ